MSPKMTPAHFIQNLPTRTETAHIILTGEMTLTMNGRTATYRA